MRMSNDMKVFMVWICYSGWLVFVDISFSLLGQGKTSDFASRCRWGGRRTPPSLSSCGPPFPHATPVLPTKPRMAKYAAHALQTQVLIYHDISETYLCFSGSGPGRSTWMARLLVPLCRGTVPTTTLTFCCRDQRRTTCAVETLCLDATSYEQHVPWLFWFLLGNVSKHGAPSIITSIFLLTHAWIISGRTTSPSKSQKL